MTRDRPSVHGGETLTGDFYDVWTVDLGQAAAVSQCLRPLLDADELRRATRFLRPELGDRFCAARGLLRLLLARYLNEDPRRLRFRAGQFGKPELIGDDREPPLAFNVSHSGDVAAYCVSRCGPVGVDVEWMRTVGSMERLLTRVGTAAEQRRFRSMSPTDRQAWFFRLWTRKEAVAKAIGEGMRLPFDRLHVMNQPVGFDPALPTAVRLLVPGREGESSTEWTIRDLPSGNAYCGAVATPVGIPGPVRQWRLAVGVGGQFAASRVGD